MVICHPPYEQWSSFISRSPSNQTFAMSMTSQLSFNKNLSLLNNVPYIRIVDLALRCPTPNIATVDSSLLSRLRYIKTQDSHQPVAAETIMVYPRLLDLQPLNATSPTLRHDISVKDASGSCPRNDSSSSINSLKRKGGIGSSAHLFAGEDKSNDNKSVQLFECLKTAAFGCSLL